MLINIKYMGLPAVRANKTEESIEFNGVNLADLLDVLFEKYGKAFSDALLLPSGKLKIAVLVNSQASEFETVLEDGDLVVFFQPSYGG